MNPRALDFRLVGNEGMRYPYIPLSIPFKGLHRVPHSLIPLLSNSEPNSFSSLPAHQCPV